MIMDVTQINASASITIKLSLVSYRLQIKLIKNLILRSFFDSTIVRFLLVKYYRAGQGDSAFLFF